MSISWVFSKVSQPGNLGFVARVMNTFGYDDLRLIACCDHLDSEALRFATHGAWLLKKAKIYRDLSSALADRTYVVGTSLRVRSRLNVPFTSWQLREKLTPFANQALAFVFGNETSGLSNIELGLCHSSCYLPGLEGRDRSFNLSHAAAIFMYEAFACQNSSAQQKSSKLVLNRELAAVAELESFKKQLFDMLELSEFLQPKKKVSLQQSIAAIMGRTLLTKQELNIIRAIVSKSSSTIMRLKSQLEQKN